MNAGDPYVAAWRSLIGEMPGAASPALPADALERLEGMVGSALVHHALDSAGVPPQVDPARSRRSLLLNRLNRHRQIDCLARLASAGIAVVAMKGFASGHTLYPDPDLRVTGDLDVLIRQTDVAAAAQLFIDLGFRVATDIPLAAWGFTSEASYLPIVSADEVANVDLHIEPDCYPLYRGLNVDAVFAAARTITVGTLSVLVPSPEHSLLIAVSNATKERFDRATIKSLLDLPRLIRGGVNWGEVVGRARSARLLRPLEATLALLVALGFPASSVPAELSRHPGVLMSAEMARVAVEVRHFYPHEIGAMAKVRRELLISAEPLAVAYRVWLRLRGLMRPRTGDPRAMADAA